MTEPMDRAAQRIVEDTPVDVEPGPPSGRTVHGPTGRKPIRARVSRFQSQVAVMRQRQRLFNHPGHSSQKSHGRRKTAVRESLTAAATIGELNAAASAEAKRITGRDIPFDMTGSDLQIGREHAEGVLRGLERFPNAPLGAVRTYGPGHPFVREYPDAFAVTQGVGFDLTGHPMKSDIYFNVNKPYDTESGLRDRLHEAAQSRYLVDGTPTGTALHEFGHVLAFTGGQRRDVYDHAVAAADAAGASPRAYIAYHVSAYASSSMSEYSAEIFADVMVNGDNASELSKGSFEVLERTHRK